MAHGSSVPSAPAPGRLRTSYVGGWMGGDTVQEQCADDQISQITSWAAPPALPVAYLSPTRLPVQTLASPFAAACRAVFRCQTCAKWLSSSSVVAGSTSQSRSRFRASDRSRIQLASVASARCGPGSSKAGRLFQDSRSMSVISTALRKLRRPCKSQSAICVNNNQLRHELPGARCASHALPSLPTCVTISICCGRPSWRVRHRRLRRRWRWQGGTGRQRARFLIRRSACRTGPFPYDGPHPLILPRVM